MTLQAAIVELCPPFRSAYISIFPYQGMRLHGYVSNRLAYYHHKAGGRRVERKGEWPVSPLQQAGNSSSAKVSRAEPSRAKAERLPLRPSCRHIIAESDGLLCGKKKRRCVRAEQCSRKLGLPRLGGTGRSLGGGAPLYHKRRHYRATDFSDNTTFTNNRILNISLGCSDAR